MVAVAVMGASGAAGVALTLAGLHRRRVPRGALAEAWPWVIAASVLWTVGACVHDLGPEAGGVALVGLALESVALVVLAVGLVARSRQVAGRDPLPVLDAAVVMVAAGFPGYVVLTEAVSGVDEPALRTLLYGAQLAVALLLGAVGYVIAAGESRRAVSTGLLATAGLAAVVAHGLDQYLVLHPGDRALSDGAVPVAVAAMPLLVAAAAWSADAAADLASRRARRRRTGAAQIVVVGVASVLVPVVIGVEVARHGRVHLGEGIVIAVVLISLVMTRVMVLVRRLGRQADALEARLWTDPVTGLGNRESFLRRLDEVAALGARRGALVLVGVDRITEMRDALGMATADALLHAVGARLAGATTSGCVARVGPGAFGVLLPDAGDRDEAHLVARALLDGLASPLALDGLSLRVGAAAGVVLFGAGRSR